MAGISKKLTELIGDESVNGWARRHGLKAQTVHGWIQDDRMPYDSNLKALAAATGRRVEWWKGLESSVAYLTEPIKPLVSGSGEQRRLVTEDRPRDDAYVYIDKYVNVRGAAGAGQEVQEEAIVQVRMDARLLRERVGNNFGHLKLAGVSGDSMEPTLSHGDQVVVDTSCDRFIDDAIYAIQQDGHLRFKRIKLRLDGSIVVKSDNPVDNDPETYTAEEAQYFKVIGIVIPFKFGRFKI